jgi:DNA-binding PadR family transcriptional regulator
VLPEGQHSARIPARRGAAHILHHAATEEIHGVWITQELPRHGYDISPGSLYPTLHRLQADGLLT